MFSSSDYDDLVAIMNQDPYVVIIALLVGLACTCFLTYQVIESVRVSNISACLRVIGDVFYSVFVMSMAMATGLFSGVFRFVEIVGNGCATVGECIDSACGMFNYVLMFPFRTMFCLVVELCQLIKMIVEFFVRLLKNVFYYMPGAFVNWNFELVGSLTWGLMLVVVKEVNTQFKMLSSFFARAYVHLRTRFWQENKQKLDAMAGKCHTILAMLKFFSFIVMWWYAGCYLHDFVEQNTGYNMIGGMTGHKWKSDMSLGHMSRVSIKVAKFLFAKWKQHGVPLMYKLYAFMKTQWESMESHAIKGIPVQRVK